MGRASETAVVTEEKGQDLKSIQNCDLNRLKCLNALWYGWENSHPDTGLRQFCERNPCAAGKANRNPLEEESFVYTCECVCFETGLLA